MFTEFGATYLFYRRILLDRGSGIPHLASLR